MSVVCYHGYGEATIALGGKKSAFHKGNAVFSAALDL